MILIAIFVALFLGFALLSGSTPESKQKQQDRFAVEFCREQAVKDANGNASMERLLLGACEKRAEEFKKKYGVEP